MKNPEIKPAVSSGTIPPYFAVEQFSESHTASEDVWVPEGLYRLSFGITETLMENMPSLFSNHPLCS
jgi:hypothetical protein